MRKSLFARVGVGFLGDIKEPELNFNVSRFANEEALREIHGVLAPGGVLA